LLISNHNSFRVLLDRVASVYFIWKRYLYFSVGNGQHVEPALCQLYRHTFVPYCVVVRGKNRASATGNVHIKFSEVWTCGVSEICERTDIHTDRHTDTLGAILRTDTIDIKKRCYVCFYIFLSRVYVFNVFFYFPNFFLFKKRWQSSEMQAD